MIKHFVVEQHPELQKNNKGMIQMSKARELTLIGVFPSLTGGEGGSWFCSLMEA
jgi:hypothetical protein